MHPILYSPQLLDNRLESPPAGSSLATYSNFSSLTSPQCRSPPRAAAWIAGAVLAYGQPPDCTNVPDMNNELWWPSDLQKLRWILGGQGGAAEPLATCPRGFRAVAVGVSDGQLQLELRAGPGEPTQPDLLPRLGLVQSARARQTALPPHLLS